MNALRSSLLRPADLAAIGLRLLTPVGVLTILAGGCCIAAAHWNSPVWQTGWLLGGAGLVAFAATLALRATLDRRGAGFWWAGLGVALLLTAFAAAFGAGLSDWTSTHARDHAATVRTAATVSGCVDRDDAGDVCTYHWQYAGHAYSSRDTAPAGWPDGHRTTVRINPHAPGHPALVSEGYWAAWIAVGVGAVGLLALLPAYALWEAAA